MRIFPEWESTTSSLCLPTNQNTMKLESKLWPGLCGLGKNQYALEKSDQFTNLRYRLKFNTGSKIIPIFFLTDLLQLILDVSCLYFTKKKIMKSSIMCTAFLNNLLIPLIQVHVGKNNVKMLNSFWDLWNNTEGEYCTHSGQKSVLKVQIRDVLMFLKHEF